MRALCVNVCAHGVLCGCRQVNSKCYMLGMLKVGRKQLFFYDKNMQVSVLLCMSIDAKCRLHMQTYHGKCLCVLDFYVHFSRQRQGIGKHLFDFMLAARSSLLHVSHHYSHLLCAE